MEPNTPETVALTEAVDQKLNTTGRPDTVEETTGNKRSKNLRFGLILGLLLLLGGGYGYYTYQHSLVHEETDDAQIEGDISPVIPRVGGYVKEVLVKDNQRVRKGDVLFTIDDEDLKIRLQQAEAALAAAKSQLGVARAGVQTAAAQVLTAEAGMAPIEAQIENAKIRVWRATQDFQRYENLIKDHSITQQQYEQAQAEKMSAERQLDILQAQRQVSSRQTQAVATQRAATGQQIAVAQANIKQMEANVAAARLNLSYAVMRAPADGQVSEINVQAGQLVQPGQAIFNLVRSQQLWVVGNFKETQLDKMELGQRVTMKVDAFPEHEIEGKITSFAAATGNKFALLPADNATGNFVKVVQRLPVKIEFTNPSDAFLQKLRPGMNVLVDVNLK